MNYKVKPLEVTENTARLQQIINFRNATAVNTSIEYVSSAHFSLT